MKDYKERNNFILRTTLLPCQSDFQKCTTKTEFCDDKSYIKIYTLDCSCKCYCTFPRSRIVTHSSTASFSIKATLCESSNILFRKNY